MKFSHLYLSGIADFTLDKNYSTCSLDICLQDIFCDKIKNSFFVAIIGASIANQNIRSKELHKAWLIKLFKFLSRKYVSQLTNSPPKVPFYSTKR